MQKKGKIIFGAVIVLIIGGIVLSLALQGMNVDAHEVKRQDVAVSFTQEGTVNAREAKPVHSLSPALLEELKVEEGERVDEGDPLAELYDGQRSFELEAPRDGIVAFRYVEEGGIAGPEKPLFKVFEPGEYDLEAMVPAWEVHDLEEGMPVMLTLQRRKGDLEFPGEVTAVAPHAEEDVSPLGLEEDRVRVTVDPELPGEADLFPGYRLEVEFLLQEESDVIAVPLNALYTFEGNDYVFIVEDNRAQEQEVTTGLETHREVVITEGLQEGDLVILDPQQEDLGDGSRVDPRIVNKE